MTPPTIPAFDAGNGRCSSSGQLYEANPRLRSLLGLTAAAALPSLLTLAAEPDARKLLDWLIDPAQPAAFLLHLKAAPSSPPLVLVRSATYKRDGASSIDLLVQPLLSPPQPAHTPTIRRATPPPIPLSPSEQRLRLQQVEIIEQWVGGLAHDLNNQLMVLMSGIYILQTQYAANPTTQETLSDMLNALQHATNLTRYLQSTAHIDLTPHPSLPISQRLRDARKIIQRVLGARITLDLSVCEPAPHAALSEGGFGLLLLAIAWAVRCVLPSDNPSAHLSIRAEPGPKLLISLQTPTPPRDPASLLDATHIGAQSLSLRSLCDTLHVTWEVGPSNVLALALPPSVTDLPPQEPLPLSDDLKGQGAVLVVIQSDEGRAAVSHLLIRAGYSVIEAHSAGDALLMAEQRGAAAAVLHAAVADAALPWLDGPSLCDRLRARWPQLIGLCIDNNINNINTRSRTQSAPQTLPWPVEPDALLRALRPPPHSHEI